MRTLNVIISENDFQHFGLKTEQLTFGDLVDSVRRELAVESLKQCIALSKKNGYSEVTLEEINEEIEAIRNATKTRD